MSEVIDIDENIEEPQDDIKKPKNIPLRIIDIAKATKIQDGSIRHYRNRFYKYMPVVGEGRKRRYQPYVVDLMLDIKKGFDHGLPAEEIDRVLAQKYPICQDKDFNLFEDDEDDMEENKLMTLPMPDQVNTMASLFAKHIPTITDNLNSVNNRVVNIEENIGNNFKEILDKLNDIANENKELKNEIKQLKEEKSKGFWNKLFRKKDGENNERGNERS